ncbi:MAG: 4Fe-4S binding protein [Petrotogales bacterium]
MDLKTRLFNMELANPVMPASGPLTGDDKKMLFIANQGVGAMVTKTISIRAAKVPRPCIISGNNYVINAELWSEFDYKKWLDEFLPSFRKEKDSPLIVSLGYTVDDLKFLVPKFSEFADAFELSTHYVANDPELMSELIKTVKSKTDKPVIIKFDPSVEEPGKMAQVIEKAGGDGIAAINSLGPVYFLDLDEQRSPLGSEDGFGWISGPVIKLLSLATVRKIASNCNLPVIGIGGIISAKDVLEYLMAGATAVQLLSGALIRGKSIYKKIISDLPSEMEKHGIISIKEIIGVSTKNNIEASYTKNTPVIDHERCTLCGLCVDACPYYALEIKDKKVEVNEGDCFGCGLCQTRCPVKAIGGVLFE